MVRMIPRKYRKSKWKVVFLWILGSFCMLMGSITANMLQKIVERSFTGFLIIFLLALIFFLTGCLLWIAVALGLREIV